MRRAIERLNPAPDYLLVDAITVDLPIAQRALDPRRRAIPMHRGRVYPGEGGTRRVHVRMGPGLPAIRPEESQRLLHRRALEGARNHGPTSAAPLQLLAGARAFAARTLDRLSAARASCSRTKPRSGRMVSRRMTTRRSGNGRMQPVEPQTRRRRAAEAPARHILVSTSSAFCCSSLSVSKLACSCCLSLDGAVGHQFDRRAGSLAARPLGSAPISAARSAASASLNIYISLGEVFRLRRPPRIACLID